MNDTPAPDALPGSTPIAGLPIVCADGVPWGTAEALDREYIRTAPATDGQRHFIPQLLVTRVDGAVHLSLTHDQLLGTL